MKVNAIKIESLLAVQGLTKTELAKKAGMSRQNVSTVVRRGTCEPRTAGKLASALGVDIADIIVTRCNSRMVLAEDGQINLQ